MLSMNRWNPVDELTRLHREMDRMFSRVWADVPGERADGVFEGHGAFVPATEMASDTEAWYVRLALPGVDPSDVHVEVSGNILSVSGERRHETTTRESQLSEIRYGRFERHFTIPARVDADKVRASFSNGILELTLPLQEAAKPRRIEIAGDSKRIAAA